MKVIIAGGRNVKRLEDITAAVRESGFLITEVVSGGAYGADRLGEEWARDQGIPVRTFRPDWSLGKAAGPIRNRMMGLYADAAIVIWDGQSRGSKHMVSVMHDLGKLIHQLIVEPAKS